jgi:hypothetical protein
MLTTVLGITIDVNELQELNAEGPIDTQDERGRKTTDAKKRHKKKVFSPMLVTEVGIFIAVRAAQPSNAEMPIVVTEDPRKVAVVSAVQSLKALSPMLVTAVGIVIAVRAEQL